MSVSKTILAFLSGLVLTMALSVMARESVPNGIYLIEKRTDKALVKRPPSLLVLKNNPKFLQSKNGYFVLKKNPFVPLTLDSSKTNKGVDDKGRPKLLLCIEKNQVKPLEKLTGDNLGKDIAIVLDGKVVSAHQIKQTIKNGQFQITRCFDNGCKTLYIELKKRQDI